MNTQTVNYTRIQRLNNACTHEQYFNQFVTPEVLSTVANRFSKASLIKAIEADHHLNNIPLSKWDSVAFIIRPHVSHLLKDAGDFYTLAGGVCIAKAAARIIATS